MVTPETTVLPLGEDAPATPSAPEANDAAQLSKARRIELILRQLDSLPTLPAIATRLLQITASDASQAKDVVELVAADPPLTAKILSLCKSAERGVRSDATLTVEKAVVLLGFNTVRNAVLSLKVYELFEGESQQRAEERLTTPGSEEEANDGAPAFDRAGLWTHSLAVALAAEAIARAHPQDHDLDPDEAFVCGLLHDVGKLSLELVLPQSYRRVVQLAHANQQDLAEYERKIIGLDHHTAGKRLAEQWGLPHRLQDCIWLHGSTLATLPQLEHRRLVGLLHLADLHARRQHLGWSGNHALHEDPDALAQELGLDPAACREAVHDLYTPVEARGKALGLHDLPAREVFMASIQSANAALGRLNHQLDIRSKAVHVQSRVLESIQQFHEQTPPARSIQDTLDAVAVSAQQLLGQGFYSLLYPDPSHKGRTPYWLITQYDDAGQPTHAQGIEAPPHAPDLMQLDDDQPLSMNIMGLLPWIADYLIEAPDLRNVMLLPLCSGWGCSAVLLHDRASLPPWRALSPLTKTWGMAVASAAQHQGARRLGEELAEANHALAQAQDRLSKQEALARLGEMAAGAAHEMNNPLAIISGRSQLLAMNLEPGSKEQAQAQQVFREAHRLSDLITCLHMIAEPPRADRKPIHLAGLVNEVVSKVKSARRKRDTAEIFLTLRDDLPTAYLDADQVSRAVTELLINAIQAGPKSSITVNVFHRPFDDTGMHAAVIDVVDDGEGMDGYTLQHAMDPFFSSKAAGRQVGMGLTRAQQHALAHGGRLELSSTPGKGTRARLVLPMDPVS